MTKEKYDYLKWEITDRYARIEADINGQPEYVSCLPLLTNMKNAELDELEAQYGGGEKK